MKTKLIVALLFAVSASVTAPAFASGYGPAPFYKPSVGAPASQSGQSLRTVAADREDATSPEKAYGGAVYGLSQAGSHVAVTPRDNFLAHH
ncbi:hypothetical protein A6V36_36885 [Paraburkholderia ginsengiterrae]|uniref:Uncharacterized protein n=1 Tax=Paraburkholderia ginsengiterrae TaxID=1462993 RepID=A0A1A9MYP7_9BURK|nr:hypothetical protein [Paraburkholderia ginsengiterrae]OAJ51736.1 hypothetical protein A6V37_37245 [Paraburkholderia ginsengiterrae]OAJ53653.1 hypothetical protein A6V36_36885 [Paraburkholderia ginsengiterrae]